MTLLGLLNFLVLQWFGVRLYGNTIVDGELGRILSISHEWRLLRWVWPLTGWWSPYRWIGRPSSAPRIVLRAVDRATAKIRKVNRKLRRIARRRG